MTLSNDGGADTSKVVPTAVDNGNNTYTITWKGLPLNALKSDPSEKTRAVTYTVSEDLTKMPAYKAVMDDDVLSGSAEEGDPIALSLKNAEETVKITVTKNWDDTDIRNAQPTGENGYARPDVTFTITASQTLKEGSQFDGVTFTDGKTATFTIPAPASGDDYASKEIIGLPKYVNGTKVEYTVEENVPAGFEQTDATTNIDISDSTNAGVGGATNKPDSRDKLEGELAITVKKVDGASAAKSALAGAKFQLTPPEGSESEPVGATTGADGTATFTLTEVGVYTLKEVEAPAGYKLDSTEWKIETDKELASIKQVKENVNGTEQTFWQWLYNLIFKDGGQSSAAFEFDADGKSGTLTVENEPLVANIAVSKVWDDANDQDGKRTGEMPTVKLERTFTPDDADSWKPVGGKQAYAVPQAGGAVTGEASGLTWKDLPAYEDGKKISYRVVEDGQIAGYSDPVCDKNAVVLSEDGKTSSDATVSVANSYEPAKTAVTFTKTWDDNGNANGNRPSADEFVKALTLENDGGVDTSEVKPTATDNGDGTYIVTWEGLPLNAPKTDASVKTKAVTYTVSEDASKLLGYKADTDGAVLSGSGSGIDLKLTNTEVFTKVKVVKTWDDANDKDGIRKDVNATVHLFRTVDGQKSAVGDAVAVGAQDGWSNEWTELPVAIDGKQASYSVEETLPEASGYTKSGDGEVATAVVNGEITVEVTNSHTPEGESTDDNPPGPGGNTPSGSTGNKQSATGTTASAMPNTGDTTNIDLFGSLFGASLLSLLAALFARRRTRDRR